MLLLSLTTATSTSELLLLSTAEKKKSAKRNVSHGHYECQEGTRRGKREGGGRMSYAVSSLSEFSCGAFCFYFYKTNGVGGLRRHSQLHHQMGVAGKKSRQHKPTKQLFNKNTAVKILWSLGTSPSAHPPLHPCLPICPGKAACPASFSLSLSLFALFALVQINIFIFIVFAWTVPDRRSQRAVITRNCC